jgi:3-deoxy-D-manno-octulosonic-acid transferase
LRILSPQAEYALRAYRHAPTTFIRRVVVGRDPYWRRYFWNRWGRFSRDTVAALGGGPVIWIDALSGGETTQAVTFCHELRRRLPHFRLLFSTNNKYSYDFAQRNLPVHALVDSPWDCGYPARRALDLVKPALLVAIETLTAPVLFAEAHRRGIPTLLVSGIMSCNYHLHPSARRTMHLRPFATLSRIGAKSPEDASGFITFGARADAVSVTGNMKFDAAFLALPEERVRALRAALGITPSDRVLLAASIHPGEEAIVAEAAARVQAKVPELRVVAVPRYAAHAERMAHNMRAHGFTAALRSAGGRVAAGQVLFVDTFGELSHLYAVADVVFMGGTTYPRNATAFGQNMIEPLAQHKPIFFGPHAALWRDVTTELLAEYPALQVTTGAELAAGVETVLRDDDVRQRLAARARHIMARHHDDVGRNVALVTAVADTLRPAAVADRMRVLHVIDTLRPGGAEQLILTTARHLDRARYEFVVVALAAPLDLQVQLEAAGAPVHAVHMRSRADVAAFLRLVRVIRAYRPAIVHTHLSNANVFGRIAAWLAGVPCVLSTLHAQEYSYWKGGWRTTFRKYVDGLSVRCVNDRLLAVSRAVADDYERHLHVSNIEVLHNYVEPSRFAPIDRQEAAARRASFGWTDEFVIAQVARLDWDKGQATLVAAMTRIIRDAPNARLLLIGSGPLRAELQQLVDASHLTEVVRFVDQRTDVRDVLGIADVFAFPSIVEGFGIALVEAMAMGLPIVATRTGGITEVVTDDVDGLLVPPGDDEALADALARMYRDGALRRRLGEQARATVARRFSATVGVPALERIYSQLAAAGVSD